MRSPPQRNIAPLSPGHAVAQALSQAMLPAGRAAAALAQSRSHLSPRAVRPVVEEAGPKASAFDQAARTGPFWLQLDKERAIPSMPLPGFAWDEDYLDPSLYAEPASPLRAFLEQAASQKLANTGPAAPKKANLVPQELARLAAQGEAFAQVLLRPNAVIDASLPGGATTVTCNDTRATFCCSMPLTSGSSSTIALALATNEPKPVAWRSNWFPLGADQGVNERVAEPPRCLQPVPDFYYSDPIAFFNELQAMKAAGSPLLPKQFFSAGNGMLSYPTRLYLADGFDLMLTRAPETSAFDRSLAFFAMAADLFERLQTLHEANYVHFDIKPDNLLLDRDQLELADYGFASPSSTERPKRSPAGTELYQAPETVAAGVDGLFAAPQPSADMFSAGLTLLDMALGHTERFAGEMDIKDRHRSMDESYAAYLRQSKAAKLQTRQPNQWARFAQQLEVSYGTPVRTYIFELLALDPAERPLAADAALVAREQLLALASQVLPLARSGPRMKASKARALGRQKLAEAVATIPPNRHRTTALQQVSTEAKDRRLSAFFAQRKQLSGARTSA